MKIAKKSLKKVIFISIPSFSIRRKRDLNETNLNSDHFYIGVGIGHFIAKYILRNYPNIVVEIWRIDERVNNKVYRNVEGIKGVVYPLRGNKKFNYSIRFLMDLMQETKRSNVIIWFDGVHYFFSWIISFFLGYIMQIAHSLGGDNNLYKYRKTKTLKRKFLLKLENFLFTKNIKLAIMSTKNEREFFSQDSNSKTKILTQYIVGLDFNRWKYRNKIEARLTLGIPLEEKIILQSGRAFRNKGTDVTIKAWKKYLQQKGINLILTGVHESDELFEIVNESGCKYFGAIEHEEFPLWLSAADVYIYPPFDDITLKFAGIGYAPLEALASGTPIVCTTAHFLSLYGIDTNKHEKYIKIPSTIEDVAKMTLEIFNSPPDSKDCHLFVKKYFDTDYLFMPIEKEINTLKKGFLTHA